MVAVLQKQERKAVAYLEAVVQVKAAEVSLVAVQARNLSVFSAKYGKTRRVTIVLSDCLG